VGRPAVTPTPSIRPSSFEGPQGPALPTPRPIAQPIAVAATAPLVYVTSGSSKRAATLLRSAANLLFLGNRDGAVATLRDAVTQHPGTDEARDAAKRLLALGAAVPSAREYEPHPEAQAFVAPKKTPKTTYSQPTKPEAVEEAPGPFGPDLTPGRSLSAGRASSGGGSVHVRSYTRKDGTRVRAHTRSR